MMKKRMMRCGITAVLAGLTVWAAAMTAYAGANIYDANADEVNYLIDMLKGNGAGWDMENYKNNVPDILFQDAYNKSYKPITGVAGTVFENIYVARTATDAPNAWFDGNETYTSGHDRSIRLNYAPVSIAELKPNWVYGPYLNDKANPANIVKAPALFGMNKNALGSSWIDENDKTEGVQMDWFGDTTGSWVYDTIGTPSGHNGPNVATSRHDGEITRWRYRFLDGSYAADGEYLIAIPRQLADDWKYQIESRYSYFNENGWLVINAHDAGGYYDENGIWEDYTFGTIGGPKWNLSSEYAGEKAIKNTEKENPAGGSSNSASATVIISSKVK